MVTLKGVEDNFEQLVPIDSILIGVGRFQLHDTLVDYGVMGVDLISALGTGLQFVRPLQVYIPLLWHICVLMTVLGLSFFDKNIWWFGKY